MALRSHAQLATRGRLCPPSYISAILGIVIAVHCSQTQAADADSQPAANSIGMKFVTVPAGEFLMGAPESEEGSRLDEYPQHRVEITRPFLLGQFEVTQQQYTAVMEQNPSYFSTTGGGRAKVEGLETSDFPVEQISWDEAAEFCRKLSELPAEKKAGRSYRLPTEAEWQYACRAGQQTPFSVGNQLGSDQANINGNFPYGDAERGPYLGRTAAVGSYEPNQFGLFDMHGNVAEMCQDWYARYYYRESPTTDPQGPVNGSDRVVMGGSWASDALRCRCAYRRSNATSGSGPYFGFRVVCVQNDRQEK